MIFVAIFPFKNLQCESKQQAEEYLQKNQFEYEWHENEALAIWQVMPALRPHRRTGISTRN